MPRIAICSALVVCLIGGASVPAFGQEQDVLFTLSYNWHADLVDAGTPSPVVKCQTATSLLRAVDLSYCSPDVPACMSITASHPVLQPFGTSGDGLADINTSPKLEAVFAMTPQVKIVSSITYCDGQGNFDGCTRFVNGTRNIIITAQASAAVWAHEFGHSAGFRGEDYSCSDRIMFHIGNVPDTRSVITADEYVVFKTLIPSYTYGGFCSSAVPSAIYSYYVPQAGSDLSHPIEGEGSFGATPYFRGCPNNDGASYPNHARIKIVAKDANNQPVAGIAAADVQILFNGGTPSQGFSGFGADSVVAFHDAWNSPDCTDLRELTADGSTDGGGSTYITFTGTLPGSPGVGQRDAFRKWGHYDTEFPVYVRGIKISGRPTSGGQNGTYTLRVKSVDVTGGTTYESNPHEIVDGSDFNSVTAQIGQPPNFLTYWRDFNNDGVVNSTDLSILNAHLSHDCGTPLNP